MRTKTLLATAAVIAAGFTSALAAEVYSLNVVGYANVTVTNVSVGGGFAIVGNPLNLTNNDISNVIPPASVPQGTQVYSLSGGSYIIRNRTADEETDAPIWSGTLDLSPGKGFWVKNPTSTNIVLTFVGEVVQGNKTNAVASGFDLKASIVPQSGDLASVLNYPATAAVGPTATQIYFFRNGGYVIRIRTFNEETGDPEWSGLTAPGVGEGFFTREASSKEWVRDFTVQ